MKPELQKINQIYIQVEDYFYPVPGFFTVEKNGAAYAQHKKELEPIYQAARKEFYEIIPSLTVEDTIDAYQQGCRLLQANISGWMYHHFDRKYIPIMIKAIQDDHGHTARLFLRVLTLYANDLKDELVPLILSSLKSQYIATQEAALSAAFELQIVEALPIVQKMTKDPIPEIREIAGKFLSDWDKKTK
jgi:hypothetical protein